MDYFGYKSNIIEAAWVMWRGPVGAANFILWLKEPVEGPMPVLDKCLLNPLKVCYLILRLSLRLVVGKRRRDRMSLARKFWLDRGESPSFHLMKWLHESIGMGGRKNGAHLLKIRVPKQGYEYFCRTDKGDFTPGREDDVMQFFAPKEGDVVVDVGAHIGRYTITSAMRVGPGGKVISIEAAPDNFEMLNRNIRLNKLTNVLPLNCAAYSRGAKIKLYEPSADFSIYNTIMQGRTSGGDRYVEVDANTLDSILNEIGIAKVDWIKIDVEGAEFEVLKGSASTLSSNQDIALLVEVHDIQDSNHYKNIAEFLYSYGFKAGFEKTYSSGERHVIFRKQENDAGRRH